MWCRWGTSPWGGCTNGCGRCETPPTPPLPLDCLRGLCSRAVPRVVRVATAERAELPLWQPSPPSHSLAALQPVDLFPPSTRRRERRGPRSILAHLSTAFPLARRVLRRPPVFACRCRLLSRQTAHQTHSLPPRGLRLRLLWQAPVTLEQLQQRHIPYSVLRLRLEQARPQQELHQGAAAAASLPASPSNGAPPCCAADPRAQLQRTMQRQR